MSLSKRSVDHEGREFDSMSAMCIHWCISINTYAKRIAKGWSVERALTIPVATRRNSRMISIRDDEDGDELESISAYCVKHGIDYNSFLQKVHDGQTSKEAKDAIRAYQLKREVLK